MACLNDLATLQSKERHSLESTTSHNPQKCPFDLSLIPFVFLTGGGSISETSHDKSTGLVVFVNGPLSNSVALFSAMMPNAIIGPPTSRKLCPCPPPILIANEPLSCSGSIDPPWSELRTTHLGNLIHLAPAEDFLQLPLIISGPSMR